MLIKSETLKRETDVFVAGGGMAGVCCALAAARNGAKVILCQDRSTLGGNASSEIRMHVVGADCSGKRGRELETEAREGGIIEEIRLENTVHNPQRSASIFDLILYDKCRRESNLRVMLNTAVTAARIKSGKIQSVTALRESTEECFKISAQIYVDCTGDGRLGVEAGARFREGREERAAFNEGLAETTADSKRLGSTLMFLATKHDRPMPFTAPPWARVFSEDELIQRPHANAASMVDAGLEYGWWWMEWGGTLDTIKDNEKIRDELLAILMGAWNHVKNGGEHGADNWALDWVGFLPGKRESRRFIGLHTLTQSDIMQSTPFDDAIAYGGWPIDTHPPEGVDTPDLSPCTQHSVPHLYDIPLRACLSENIGNLIFAGRNISATHIGFASTRVMATCAIEGEGVGTAAAFAIKKNCLPSELAANPVLMHSVQQQLLRYGAYLIGQVNEDSKDLARRATITASSEQPEGRAVNVISGATRAVHGSDGAPPERTNAGTHRWMSDPAQGLPQWIQLRWDNPVSLNVIELTFDTGLHRVLTFSHSNAYTAMMQWGCPQSETVKDYRIDYEKNGSWNSLVKANNLYQRRNVHAIEPITVEALRITVTATNGINHARICEIRVY
jgi:hypothetical protein